MLKMSTSCMNFFFAPNELSRRPDTVFKNPVMFNETMREMLAQGHPQSWDIDTVCYGELEKEQ